MNVSAAADMPDELNIKQNGNTVEGNVIIKRTSYFYHLF